MPPEGYYPDPAGSAYLRWWDGQQWTERFAVHAAPGPVAPSPAPFVAPSTDPPRAASDWAQTSPYAATVPATSHRLDQPAPGLGRAAVMVGGGIALLVVLAVVVGWRASTAPARPAATPPRTAPVAVVAPTTSEPAKGGPLVTPAQAADVVDTFWAVHEPTLVARDVDGLLALTTGAGRFFEPGTVACGCRVVDSVRTATGVSLFVPRQTRYPAHFMAEVQTQPSNSWVEVYVFTKAEPGAPWLVALNSGYAAGAGPRDTPAVDAAGYLRPVDPDLHRAGAPLPQRITDVWQTTVEQGRPPNVRGLLLTRSSEERLATIAGFGQDQVSRRDGLLHHYEFYLDPGDPLFEYPTATGMLVCRAVRERVVHSAPRGRQVRQDAEQRRFGVLLAPGQYDRVITDNAWPTCFRLSGTGVLPATLLNQHHGGAVPSAG